jgi:hypothetical protein
MSAYRGALLRWLMVMPMVLQTTSASAVDVELKGVKFGADCTGPLSTYGRGFGSCMVAGSKYRIWCPNGKVIERNSEWPNGLFVLRAICGLNQAP